MVEQKGADYVLAFEELEALRDLPYLKDGGTLDRQHPADPAAARDHRRSKISRKYIADTQ